MMRTALFLGLVAAAMAACPNGCSGNGICGANDKCSCYQNWQGPDCSARTCTFSLAWADTADGTNQAHYYAECSNKGTCDRKTGECKCFDGYEGKGCRRSTCPESCSGHGTCEYIDELAGDYYDRRTGPGAKYEGYSSTAQNTAPTTGAQGVSNAIASWDKTRVHNGFIYQLWDSQKIQGCKCDLGYSGPDCSSRVAPKGDDPLTTVKSALMTQAVLIDNGAAISSGEFFLVYHDPYGGVWRTDTIAATSDDAIAATRAKDALHRLPNEVLNTIDVVARTAAAMPCYRNDGVQHIPSAGGRGTTNLCATSQSATWAPSDNAMDFNIQFAAKPGQTGTQYLFEVGIAAAKSTTEGDGKGYYPTSAGMATTATASVFEVLGSGSEGTVSENAECSDRGLDNGDGECECFDGFRGLACENQEALI